MKDLTSHRRTLTITSAVAVRGTLNGPTIWANQTVPPFLHNVQQLQFCSGSGEICTRTGSSERLAGRLVDRAQAMPSDANDEMWLTSCRAFHSLYLFDLFFVADTL